MMTRLRKFSKFPLYLCAFLISGTALADTPQATLDLDMSKAQGLYDLCRGDGNAKTLCMLYVAGYFSGYVELNMAYVSANPLAHDIGPFCPHVSVDPKLMADLFVSYMGKHPEKGRDNWPDALTAALADHWPCKKPG